MTVTTAGSRSCTTPTTGSVAPGATLAALVANGVATGRAPAVSLGDGAGELPDCSATGTHAEIRRTSAHATGRSSLTRALPPRNASGFGRCARRGASAAGGRTSRFRLDHLTDGRRADLEIDVSVRLDLHVPRARELDLLVHALESLLGVRDRVDRLRRDLARRVDRERD